MGKVQIVTGGTSGMGKATAKAISKYGPVVIAGRSLERMQGALDELKAAHPGSSLEQIFLEMTADE
jgi:NAD(P)-dependent dehydrogenase (short-subunit alcohol dehydrogenase family)